jgi:hypothetical protein
VRHSQYRLRPNFLVCLDHTTSGTPCVLSLEDGRNGASTSTPGDSEAKLKALQPTNGVDAPLPVPEVKLHTETVGRNYVIHEISQDESATRPPWKDTMTAMFGSHVKWEDVRAYVSRGRPLCGFWLPHARFVFDDELHQSARPTQLCPITGRPARYLDPRTKVPYATPAAYRTLTMILNHEYVWSHTLGCYVTRPDTFATTPQDGTANGD